MSGAKHNELIHVAEAAALLAVDPSTVRRWFDKRLLSGRQYPTGAIRISKSSVDQLIYESTPLDHKSPLPAKTSPGN